jgi:hypothetical protein
MIKPIILFFLKRLIKILNFNKNLFLKYSPIYSLFSKILSLFLFIRSSFKFLLKYSIFKYLTIILRVLSFSSLFLNFILFIILSEIRITRFPDFNFNNIYLATWLPDSFKNWCIDLWNKIKAVGSIF